MDANVRIELLYSRDEIAGTLEGIHGNTIVGTLDDELISLYVTMVNVELELEDALAEMRKRIVRKSAEIAERSTGDGKSAIDAYHQMLSLGAFDNDEEADIVLKLAARFQHLSATFWYDVRMHFNLWNAWLEVRNGFRIVNLGRKYNRTNG